MDFSTSFRRSLAPVAPARFQFQVVAMGLFAALAVSAAPAAEIAGAEVVKVQCSRCHEAGAAGAPKIGDKAAWAPRLTRGIDALVLAAIRGHGGMPPRGGRADLTDTELRNALLYMFNPAGPPKAPPKGAQASSPRGAGPHRATAGGMDIYLGLVSAERMHAFPAGSPEASMHGGIPAGSGYHHVNVSLFDSASQVQLTDASVELEVEQVGMGGETKKLEPMTVSGGVSYGNYVRLAPKGNYVFVVRVQKAGATQPVEVKFQEHLN